jgi:spore coat polysaccharide biosynthesis predicted glycosyltransferase SpsG
MTLYEGLASGTPVVGLCLAANQRANVDELCAAGIILGGAPSLEAALQRAAGDLALRRALSARGRRLVDGRGASRVADEVARACASTGRQRSAR